MTYQFDQQLDVGKAGEWVMDKYHAPYYYIEKATQADERNGIDRWYRNAGNSYGVEIKTDRLAQKYGNIIIETVSVDTNDTPGWAYTTKCDVLIFYLWHLDRVLYFHWPKIKPLVPELLFQYGDKAVIPNKTYNTRGIKLPLSHAESLAFYISHPVDPYWMKENHKEWRDHNGR